MTRTRRDQNATPEAPQGEGSATPDGERRRSPRPRALLPATLAFDGVAECLEVMVRDLTQEGAKLFVLAETALPERFVLEIPERKTTRRVELRWRRLDHAGVSFLDEGDA